VEVTVALGGAASTVGAEMGTSRLCNWHREPDQGWRLCRWSDECSKLSSLSAVVSA